MAETIDLVLQVKAQSEQARTEILRTIETLQALKNSTDNLADKTKFEEQIQQYRRMAEALKEAGEAAEKMTLSSLGKGAAELANKFQNITKELKGFADDTVATARELMKFEKIIKNTSETAGQAKDTLNFLKEYSLSNQPFETTAIYEASAQLSKFHLNIKETLPLVAGLAASFDNDLAKASMVVSRALTGTRGGVTMLAREYGITAERMKEYGAEMTKSGEVEDDSVQTKQAIIKLLQEMQSNTDKASSSYAASLNQYQNQMTDLKIEIGKNLIPLLTTVTKFITELTKAIGEIPGGKEAFVALSSGVLGVVLVGNQLAGTVGTIARASTAIYGMATGVTTLNATIMAAVPGMTAYQASIAATVGIAGGLAIALGIAANAWLKYKEAQSLEEQEKINALLSEQKKTLEALGKKYDEVLNPMEAVRKVQSEIVSGGLEWTKTAEGQEKVALAIKLVNDQLAIAKSAKEDYLNQGIDLKNNFWTQAFGMNSKERDDNLKNLQLTIAQIKTLENTLAVFQNTQQKALDGKNFDGLKKTFGDLRKDFDKMFRWDLKIKVDEKDFNSFISTQDKLVSSGKKTYFELEKSLLNYKNKYELTKSQELVIDEKLNETKKRIADEQVKAVKKSYDDFVSAQKLSLSKGEINESQYYANLKKYLSQHAAELNKNKDLKTQIETEYYTGINRLAEEQANRQKERQEKAIQEEKERKQKLLEYGQQLLQEQERQQEAAEEEKKQAAEKKKLAEEEFNKAFADLTQTQTEKAIASINEQVKKWQESGVERIKLEEYTQKAIQKLSDETADKFKEQEKQKRAEIEETLKTLQQLTQQQEDNKKKRDEVLFGFDNSSPVMSMADAFNPDRKTKWDKAEEIEKENAKLEEEKQRYQSKLASQKAEEKKLTEEAEKAQTAFNTALGVTQTAYNSIKAASPWDSEISKIKTATEAVKEYNNAKSGNSSSASTGGNYSPLLTPKMTQAVSSAPTDTGGGGGYSSSDSYGDMSKGTWFGTSGGEMTELSNNAYAFASRAANSLNSANTSIDRRVSNNSSVTNITLNVNGSQSSVKQSTVNATNQILSDSGAAKYLTRRGS